MKKIIVPIRGMHCRSCELLLEEKLGKIPEAVKVSVNHVSGQAKIWFVNKSPARSDLEKAIEEAGYQVGVQDKLSWFSRDSKDYVRLLNAAAILLFLYILAKFTGLGGLSVNLGEKSVAMAGVIGLAAGFSSCMALIGGLVLGFSARYSERHPEAGRMEKFRPHLFFNLGRVLGFAVLGGLIGLLGSALQPSARVLGVMTIAVALVMVFLGLKLVGIFPVLRNKNIALPKSVSRALKIHKEDKGYSHLGTFLSGALSFFLPCGFTQAMQLYAISTGSFVQGASIMALFALGTAPGLLGVGGLSAAFKGLAAKMFFTVAGLAVIFLGVFNISNASRLVFPSWEGVRGPFKQTLPSGSSGEKESPGAVQLLQAKYAIEPGLEPETFTVKAGQPVKLEVDVLEDDYGCMGSIMIPGLFPKAQFMKRGQKIVMQFTPKKAGNYRITCAMGVPHGTLKAE